MMQPSHFDSFLNSELHHVATGIIAPCNLKLLESYSTIIGSVKAGQSAPFHRFPHLFGQWPHFNVKKISRLLLYQFLFGDQCVRRGWTLNIQSCYAHNEI